MSKIFHEPSWDLHHPPNTTAHLGSFYLHEQIEAPHMRMRYKLINISHRIIYISMRVFVWLKAYKYKLRILWIKVERVPVKYWAVCFLSTQFIVRLNSNNTL